MQRDAEQAAVAPRAMHQCDVQHGARRAQAYSYGSEVRLETIEQRRVRLKQICTNTLRAGGNVLIPTDSAARVFEILLTLNVRPFGTMSLLCRFGMMSLLCRFGMMSFVPLPYGASHRARRICSASGMKSTRTSAAESPRTIRSYSCRR
jgi:hypothetical protein